MGSESSDQSGPAIAKRSALTMLGPWRMVEVSDCTCGIRDDHAAPRRICLLSDRTQGAVQVAGVARHEHDKDRRQRLGVSAMQRRHLGVR